ncbi:MAG: formate--tetrahydrofolate ligase [Dehalococcoidia bacterium]|nr:formate--tetrahydrofolate ligase [Dehalococcoidia bacterium]
MRPVSEIAGIMGIDPALVIPYGRYKAKISLEAIKTAGPRGDLVVVTGITPTPLGEGKTTMTVGLAQGLGKLGKRVVACLREPSLGPIFGIKGGGTGGGACLVEPQDEVNVHFTGDAHAVASAHNLLAALTDNAAQRGQVPGFGPSMATWRRVTDVEDRALRDIVTGMGGLGNAPIRQTGFDIVTASEIMAILALSLGLDDLRSRLGRIVVGFNKDGKPVTAQDVGAVGSMLSLLRYALQPNLVQTTEGQPVLVHTGPFGNIAHGCSSILADRLAVGYSDYVLTEAGFGSDLGFEKFMHIKARAGGVQPRAAVLVASVRALKYHGGVSLASLDIPDEDAVQRGMPNLEHHIGIVRSFGLPVVVAVNAFSSDAEGELDLVRRSALDAGAFSAAKTTAFSDGGEGSIELAEAVLAAVSQGGRVSYLYAENDSMEEKMLAIARTVYNARDVRWEPAARRRLAQYEELGWGSLPVCMAKTPLSISHQSSLKGRPSDYIFEVSDLRASIGAGFLYPIAGNIVTMPGLPSSPRSLDVDSEGNILGL